MRGIGATPACLRATASTAARRRRRPAPARRSGRGAPARGDGHARDDGAEHDQAGQARDRDHAASGRASARRPRRAPRRSCRPAYSAGRLPPSRRPVTRAALPASTPPAFRLSFDGDPLPDRPPAGPRRAGARRRVRQLDRRRRRLLHGRRAPRRGRHRPSSTSTATPCSTTGPGGRRSGSSTAGSPS